MPRRENVGRRRPPVAVRRTLLVYCGGQRTEPNYFEGLRASRRASSVTVKVRGEGLAPGALVQAAAAYRERRPGVFDEVWAVVDVDQFDVEVALVEAGRRNVNLAISNPCFELWLLLHHSDCRSHCAGCADAARRLKKQIPTYDKAQVDFAQFEAGVDDAIKRAKQLDPTGQDWGQNPSTGVWRLVERILEQA